MDGVDVVEMTLALAAIPDVMEDQPDDKSEQLSRFESLPLELKLKIFEYLKIEDKKQLRAVCTMFLRSIDPELAFHVKLSDETSKWVKYGDTHYVDTIEVEGLSIEFDSRNLPRVGQLIIGANNKEENIWNILKHCALSKDLEYLQFIGNSIGDLSQLNEESENYMILPWIKSLNLKVIGKSGGELLSLDDALLLCRAVHFLKYIRLPVMESLSVHIEFDLVDTDTSANLILVELYKFLNVHALPLMNLAAQLKLCRYNSPPELNTILTALELESLAITSSNSNDVIPLIRASQNLKSFKLSDRTPGALHSFRHCSDYGNVILDLLENCKSLEALALEVYSLDSPILLQLQKCVSLKSLEMRCDKISQRTAKESFHMPNLTTLNIEVKNKDDRDSAEVIQSWLDASHGLEELTMTFAYQLNQQAVSAILAMSRIQKLILMNAGGLSQRVQEFCKLILAVPCIMVEKCKCEWGWEWETEQEILGQGRQGHWKPLETTGFQGWVLQMKRSRSGSEQLLPLFRGHGIAIQTCECEGRGGRGQGYGFHGQGGGNQWPGAHGHGDQGGLGFQGQGLQGQGLAHLFDDDEDEGLWFQGVADQYQDQP